MLREDLDEGPGNRTRIAGRRGVTRSDADGGNSTEY